MRGTPNERFDAKFEVSDELAFEGTPCWTWTAYLNLDGYGFIRVGRHHVMAHRFAYERWVGEIPGHLEIDHRCRVRACVNFRHLETVTHAENVRRGEGGVSQAAKTHCPQGHAYSEENTSVIRQSNGVGWSRGCRICSRTRSRVYYEAHREEANAAGSVRARALRAADPEAARARDHAYYEANREAINAYKRTWRAAKRLAVEAQP